MSSSLEEKVKRHMVAHGFSRALVEKTMVDYTVPDTEGMKARRVVETYVAKADQMVSKGMGVLFAGPTGVGKSMLVTIIVKQIMLGNKTNSRPMLVNCDQLIQATNNMWTRDSAEGVIPLKRIIEADILVIDDVPNTLSLSRDVFQIVEQILNKRHPNNLPTFITYGKSTRELKNEGREKLISLINEKMLVVGLEGVKDRRAEKQRDVIKMFEMEDLVGK